MRLLAALTCLVVAGCASADGTDPDVATARLAVDLDIYPHRIMGEIREKAVLIATDDAGREYRVDLRDAGPGHPVFEDIAPRVVDADGDGKRDIVVVESSQTEGGQLAIYGLRNNALTKIAATPHIGTRFRWLAPIAIADLDGNGAVDLAYIDRPHLAKTLRVWSWAPGGLTEIAQLQGITNHRIGEEYISGGLRDCGNGPEMVVAEADWSGTVGVTLANGQLDRRALPYPATPDGFTRALACTD
ncbi:FG-GAP repeat domain-containing protein [Tropicimonas sp. S265A]|uniref:FG-GAP repeat domain-containing protein n=1 Tax=Tropicimonas sp. S265A TaxID=3415134 RepID=UPI003C7B8A89